MMLGAIAGSVIGLTIHTTLAVRANEHENPCPRCGQYYRCEVGPASGRCAERGSWRLD